MSTNCIGDIRSYFFKTIVELFQGYQEHIGQDEDGDTIFLIQKFMSFRPEMYRTFY